MNPHWLFPTLFLLIASNPLFAQSQETAESFTGWEEIVTDLRSSVNEPLAETQQNPSLMRDVEISAGVGMAFSFVSLDGGKDIRSNGLLKGITAQFGISLFHPSFFAEGSFRSFASDQMSRTVSVSLQEFDLRVVHAHFFQKVTLLRVGTGLSARYMDVTVKGASGQEKFEYTTPSMVFFVGMARNFGKSLQIGPDLSYRTSLIGDTVDRSSVDLGLRLAARF